MTRRKKATPGGGSKKPKPAKTGTKRKRDEENKDFDVIMAQDSGNNTTAAPFQSIKYQTKKKQRLNNPKHEDDESDVCKVSVRQKVPHKKTFYYLEQLILKHKLPETYTKFDVEEVSYGADFLFGTGHDAQKFQNWVLSVLAGEPRNQNQKTNTNNLLESTKANFSVELVPICKHDVVCLPQRLFNSMGGFGPIAICTKVNRDLFFIDPNTMKVAAIEAYYYFQKDKPFRALFTSAQLIEYTVLDVELNHEKKTGKYQQGTVQVCKSSEVGDQNAVCFTSCHFAHMLSAGDLVYGYDMKNANLNDENLASYKNLDVPDVILVKKHYEFPRKRFWKLKNWKMQLGEDYDDFLNELEEDEDLRKNINLYKDKSYEQSQMEEEEAPASATTTTTAPAKKKKGPVNPKNKVPSVSLEELLDEMSL